MFFSSSLDQHFACETCGASSLQTSHANVDNRKLLFLFNILTIQEEMNGHAIDLISANVSTGQLLYWRTDEDYFKGNSLVTTDFQSVYY
jgi:hypothetical protein